MTVDSRVIVGATQFLFNVEGSYNPADLNKIEIAGATQVVFDLTSVAAAAAEMSTKVDLGATRAPEYMVHAAIEMAVAPVTGTTFDFYWAPSGLAGAAVGNPGYVTGASGVYAGGVATLAEGLKQLTLIGSMAMSADATGTIQMSVVGVLRPTMRYGTLVVVNNTAQATHNDAVEQAVSFTPIVWQAQDEV